MNLKYPTISPTLDITIRDQQLGDTESHESNAVIRQNRSSDPLTFNDPDWPINIVKSFTVTAMERAEVDALIDFFSQSAADEITLIDQDSQEWLGTIITPIPEIITNRDDCDYEVTFEFRGVKV